LTTRKNQNSVLVLATLGVYLGLVLVGATPQVLAQAAMTRQFSVKDEVEVKDDLDKKPGSDVSDDLVSKGPRTIGVLVSSSVQRFISAGWAMPAPAGLHFSHSYSSSWPPEVPNEPLAFSKAELLGTIVNISNFPRSHIAS
jgi:hypothetical protein